MHIARHLAAQICASLLACTPAAATHLVTGNGYGFAVVSPETGAITKFYAHPYSFARPDPKNPDNKIVILTSQSGQLVRHDLNADRNSDEYKRLKDLVNAKAATATGTPQANAAP